MHAPPHVCPHSYRNKLVFSNSSPHREDVGSMVIDQIFNKVRTRIACVDD
jgi:hypothetical protein